MTDAVDRSALTGDSLRHFYRLWRRIERKEPTTIVRYADGEESLMRGGGIGKSATVFVEDDWWAPEGMSRIGRDLLATMRHTEPEFFYAIPGRNDFAPIDFLLERIVAPNAQLTFATLFCNLNYRPFLEGLKALEEEVVVLASKRAAGRDMAPLRVIEFVPMEHDCVHHWESAHAAELARARELAGRYEGTLFLVSAGPMANLLIDAMFRVNPGNRYVDVGSALDEVAQGRRSRPFMHDGSDFSLHISRF